GVALLLLEDDVAGQGRLVDEGLLAVVVLLRRAGVGPVRLALRGDAEVALAVEDAEDVGPALLDGLGAGLEQAGLDGVGRGGDVEMSGFIPALFGPLASYLYC